MFWSPDLSHRPAISWCLMICSVHSPLHREKILTKPLSSSQPPSINPTFNSQHLAHTTVIETMTSLTIPTTFTTALSSTTLPNPVPRTSTPSTLPELPEAEILSTSTPLLKPTDNVFVIKEKSIEKKSNPKAVDSNGYVHPNAITGSKKNSTALQWPDFETCNGYVHFKMREGDCYKVVRYRRSDQKMLMGFWGFALVLFGFIGLGLLAMAGLVLTMCIIG